jgi:ferredoxin
MRASGFAKGGWWIITAGNASFSQQPCSTKLLFSRPLTSVCRSLTLSRPTSVQSSRRSSGVVFDSSSRVATRRPDRMDPFPLTSRTLVNNAHQGGSSPVAAPSPDELSARSFLKNLSYADDVAEGIIAALKEPGSGVTRGELESTLRLLAGRPEVGVDAGLKSIAQAVEVELKAKRGKKLVHIHVKVPHANREFDVEGLEGMSLRDVAQNPSFKGAEELGEYLECACSGHMACSTCHVYLDENWYDKFGGEPDAAEMVRHANYKMLRAKTARKLSF